MKYLLWIAACAITTAPAFAKGRITKGEGLQYEVVKVGKGKVAESGQRVQVHYTGWLNEGGKKGKKFDSSVDRRKPFVFGLGQGQVIRGWDEGVAGMKIGEKRTLYIPSGLGYGPRGDRKSTRLNSSH